MGLIKARKRWYGGEVISYEREDLIKYILNPESSGYAARDFKIVCHDRNSFCSKNLNEYSSFKLTTEKQDVPSLVFFSKEGVK